MILKITERPKMMVPKPLSTFMSDMQRKSISFALDYFGAGHRAFRHLKEFNFAVFKIDRQFILNIAHYPDNQAITQALVTISQQFDMFTVAEDVETAAETAWSQVLCVDCLRGYHYGAPSLVPPWQTHAAQTG